MTEHCVVLTTVDSADTANLLARTAIEARAAACAQVVGPIASTYRWHGELTTDQEWQVQFKTTVDALDRLRDLVTAHHPYDLPEIVAVPVLGGSAAYLRWVTDETRPTP
jgi:periplasmic divalent cation tolerance protein